MKPEAPPQEAVLYTRAGCPPCFVLRRAAERTGRRHAIRLRVVDVAADPVLEERFGRLVPVLVLPGGRTLSGRVEPADLESAYREAGRRAMAGRRMRVGPWLRSALAALRRGGRGAHGA